MAKDEIIRDQSIRIGAAGEYLATGELLRRGWIAGLTPRGTADFDILATKNGRSIKVRVKTKTSKSKLFRWQRRPNNHAFHEPIGNDDFCILVELATTDHTPEYFITPTRDVQKMLDKNFKEWVDKDPKHDPNNRVMGIKRGRKDDDEWLSARKDNWEILLKMKTLTVREPWRLRHHGVAAAALRKVTIRGEDTKRNLKHAKQQPRSHGHGSGAAGIDLARESAMCQW